MLEQHSPADATEYATQLREVRKLLSDALGPLPHVFSELKTTSTS